MAISEAFSVWGYLPDLARTRKELCRIGNDLGIYWERFPNAYALPNVSSIARSITSGLRWLYISVTLVLECPGIFKITRAGQGKWAKAEINDRLYLHSVRYTTSSWLAMWGVPMPHIQSILGHSENMVTEKYSHLAPETLNAVMEEAFGK